VPKTIQQTVTFAAPPGRLYDLYMNPKLHAAAMGSSDAIVVSPKPGSRFQVGAELAGRTLATRPGRLIVQTWRGTDWKKSEPDSVLVLSFEPVRGGARVRLVHANIPDTRCRGIRMGWPAYYWKPWKRYLRSHP
jgi:uncharacterized protein YndB with AHSA1/START domain